MSTPPSFASRFTKKSNQESFADSFNQTQQEKAKYCFLYIGDTEQHQRAWYFIEVLPEEAARFVAIVKRQQPFDLKYFGNIIASGFGDYPPEAVISRLSEEGKIHVPS